MSIRCKNFSIHLLSGQFLDGNCARCTTEFDGCGQYLWVCPVGVAMVPDGNPKKLEPMHTYTFGGPGMQLSSSLFTFQSYLNFARMRYAIIMQI